MRALHALTALALVAGPASAGTVAIVSSTVNEVVLIDPAATKFDSKTKLFQAWTVAVRRNLADAGPPQPGYIRTLNEYDCVMRRYRWRTLMIYSRYGALVLQKANDVPEWVSGYRPQGEDPNLRAVCDDASSGAIVTPSLAQLVISLMQSWDPPAPPPAPAPAMPVAKAAKP